MAIKGSLSPSALSSLKECEKCFWLDRHGVKKPRGIVASLPSGLDEITKDALDNYRMKGQLPPEIAAQIPGAKAFTDLVKLNQWRTLGRGIHAKVDDTPVMGLLDDLLLFEDGTASPFDYKSRKSPPPEGYAEKYYQLQVNIYHLLLEANGFRMNGNGYFAFYSPKAITASKETERVAVIDFDVTVMKVKTNADDARAFVRRAVAVIAGPLPESGASCDTCAYVRTRGQRMTEIARAAKEAAAAKAQAEQSTAAAAAPAGGTN